MTRNHKKLVIVVSHPIQHFVPFYRALAQEESIDLTVVFCSRIGVEPYFDQAMNTTIAWKMDLLGGYDHVFLSEADYITSTGPRRIDNPSVVCALNRLGPDAVLVHGYGHRTMRRALRWAKKAKVASLLFGDSNLQNPRSRTKRLLKRVVLPFYFSRISAFLTISEENEKYYRNYGVNKRKIFRVPFPIDEPLYLAKWSERKPLRKCYRKSLGISENEIVIVTVGKVIDYKRPRDIIGLARRFKQDPASRPIKFLMVGDGPDRIELQAIARDEGLFITWVGFINVDRLPECYLASDILFHACGIESFGLVVAEACCMGLPVVIPEGMGAVGRNGVARPYKNALTYPAGNLEAAENILRSLVNSPRRIVEMSQYSRRAYSENDMSVAVRGVKTALENRSLFG